MLPGVLGLVVDNLPDGVGAKVHVGHPHGENAVAQQRGSAGQRLRETGPSPPSRTWFSFLLHLCTKEDGGNSATQSCSVHGLHGGDVCEPSAQAASLSLSLVPNPIGIEMRSIPHLF